MTPGETNSRPEWLLPNRFHVAKGVSERTRLLSQRTPGTQNATAFPLFSSLMTSIGRRDVTPLNFSPAVLSSTQPCVATSLRFFRSNRQHSLGSHTFCTSNVGRPLLHPAVGKYFFIIISFFAIWYRAARGHAQRVELPALPILDGTAARRHGNYLDCPNPLDARVGWVSVCCPNPRKMLGKAINMKFNG